MEIKTKLTSAGGSVYTEANGQILAEISWINGQHEGYIIADHTRVDDSLRGKGAGIKLLNILIEFAREKQIKIQPVCPFIVAMFDRSPDFEDLRYKGNS